MVPGNFLLNSPPHLLMFVRRRWFHMNNLLRPNQLLAQAMIGCSLFPPLMVAQLNKPRLKTLLYEEHKCHVKSKTKETCIHWLLLMSQPLRCQPACGILTSSCTLTALQSLICANCSHWKKRTWSSQF